MPAWNRASTPKKVTNLPLEHAEETANIYSAAKMAMISDEFA
jgi:hypothetical protein